jgi:hypothetical protein
MTTEYKGKIPTSLCQACAGWYIHGCNEIFERSPITECARFKFYPNKSFKNEYNFKLHFPLQAIRK